MVPSIFSFISCVDLFSPFFFFNLAGVVLGVGESLMHRSC